MFCNLQYNEDILCIKDSDLYRNEYVTIREFNRNDAKVKVSTSAKTGYILGVSINGLEGFTRDQERWVVGCLNTQKYIVSSLEHKRRFLALKPIQTNDKSMLEVYEHVHSGKSRWDNKADHDLDYFITLVKMKKSTLGSTSMKTGKIKLNSLVLKKWMSEGAKGQAKYIGHAWHEYIHSCGYYHRGWNKRKAMVYQAGYDQRDLAYEVLMGRELTPLTA